MTIIKRSWAFLILCGVFIIELVKASVSVAIAVFSDTSKLKPAVVAVPLDLKTDMGISTLANLVSLTPGTTSLHVSEDRTTLYVHVLDRETDEALIAEIKQNLERPVMAVESPDGARSAIGKGAAA